MPDATTWIIGVRDPMRVSAHAGRTVAGPGADAVEDADGTEVVLRPKERAVVAALVADHPRPVSVERITERVWGSDPPETALASVRNHVARIRRAAPGLVLTDATSYRLAPTTVVVGGAGTGTVLADLADTDDVHHCRHVIDDRLEGETDRRLARAVRDGPTPETIEQLRRAADAEPYREQRWVLLALSLARAGRRREALLAIQALRDHLAEVGLEPGERAFRIEQRVLAGDTDHGTAPSSELALLHPHRDEPFAGRAEELARLRQVWQAVLHDERPRLVVVEGAAGAGKTRLVDQLVHHELAGMPAERMLWGRDRGTAHREYGAIAEAVGRLHDEEPELFAGPPTLTDLIRLVAPGAGDGASDEPIGVDARARNRLGRDLARFVRRLADRPTIWLLDDAHWATADSVALLDEAFDGATGPILLVATARPRPAGALTLVGAMSRTVPVTTVSLGPLDDADVERLVASADVSVSPRDVHLLRRRTGGLALYASEIARVVRSTGHLDVATIPPAIRDWVRHRIDSLDPELVDTLRHAATIGHDVEPSMLEQVTGRPATEIARHCDELIAIGTLSFDHGSSRLSFAHELTLDIVRESIGPVLGAELDRRVAASLQLVSPQAHGLIAHHLDQARDARAHGHALDAGNQALALGAWSHAGAMFAIAVEHADGPVQRAVGLVGAGRALLGSGDLDAARSTLLEAIELARHLAPAVHARAALALVGRAGRGALHDDEAAQLATLRAALTDLVDAPPEPEVEALRCDVERELGIALLLTDAEEERRSLLVGSLDRARLLRPPRPLTLANALLSARYALLEAGELDERVANTEQVLAMPEATIDDETWVAARIYAHEDLVRAGRPEAAAEALLDAERALAAYPHPYWSWAARTWRSLWEALTGDLERAEVLAGEALRMRPDVPGAAACHIVNLVHLRLRQGRAGEVIGALRGAVDAAPNIAAYRAVLALCAAEAGDEPLARAALRWFTDEGCANLPCDTNRFLGLGVLAHAAAEIGDDDAARVLVPLLEPYGDQWVVINVYGGGGAEWGPASHALARLHARLGADATADELFRAAGVRALHAPVERERIAAHAAEHARSRPSIA